MKLSELEGCALGLLRRLGPCPAYSIQREFARSPSASWSASAGAIYPLMKKLENLGLVEAHQQHPDSERRVFRLSSAGESALREWLRLLPLNAGEAMPEPIRTRAFFLDVLTAEERRDVLNDARSRTESALNRLKNAYAQLGAVDALASSATIYELEARLRWLEHARGVCSAWAAP